LLHKLQRDRVGAIIVNDGLHAVYASEPLDAYSTRLSRRVQEMVAAAARLRARILWRSSTVIHSNVERLSSSRARALQPQLRGKVCQTTNSIANTMRYNEASARVMAAHNISVVDVFPITAFRWDRYYDCIHFFPCDHCYYPRNSTDFERSNSLMVAHAVLTVMCSGQGRRRKEKPA
jgi:hypothetical protein